MSSPLEGGSGQAKTIYYIHAQRNPNLRCPRTPTCGGIMIRRFLTVVLLAIGARLIHAQPSLPSSFQARAIHSPEAADIFVRWEERVR